MADAIITRRQTGEIQAIDCYQDNIVNGVGNAYTEGSYFTYRDLEQVKLISVTAISTYGCTVGAYSAEGEILAYSTYHRGIPGKVPKITVTTNVDNGVLVKTEPVDSSEFSSEDFECYVCVEIMY